MAKNKTLIVSDHACLRYIERYYGLPIEFFRQEIVEKLRGHENFITFTYNGFCVENRMVKTYLPTQDDRKAMIDNLIAAVAEVKA